MKVNEHQKRTFGMQKYTEYWTYSFDIQFRHISLETKFFVFVITSFWCRYTKTSNIFEIILLNDRIDCLKINLSWGNQDKQTFKNNYTQYHFVVTIIILLCIAKKNRLNFKVFSVQVTMFIQIMSPKSN